MEKKKWSQPKLLSLNNKETSAGSYYCPGREGMTHRIPGTVGPGPTYEQYWNTFNFMS